VDAIPLQFCDAILRNLDLYLELSERMNYANESSHDVIVESMLLEFLALLCSFFSLSPIHISESSQVARIVRRVYDSDVHRVGG